MSSTESAAPTPDDSDGLFLAGGCAAAFVALPRSQMANYLIGHLLVLAVALAVILITSAVEPCKPLQKELWAAAVDAVGGHTRPTYAPRRAMAAPRRGHRIPAARVAW